MKTFEKLESRYLFTGTLVLDEAMHVGSGEGDEHADSLFTRSNGKFYIPGSSLRGAFRSTVERIAMTLDIDTCLLSGDPESNCVTANPKLVDEKRREVEETGGEWNEAAQLDWLKQGHLCETCKVFGSTHFASKIKITDLYPKNSNPKGVIRYGVGIDRDTETASQGALFEIQVVEKDSNFGFELIAENLEGKAEWGLLCIGLWEMLRQPDESGVFYIGAKSATGLGRCYLQQEDFKMQSFDGVSELKQYLESGQMPKTKTANDAVNFIKCKVQSYLGGC